MTKTETLLTFPCEFTIKIFGKATLQFEATVVSIMRKHVPKLGEGAIQLNPSKENKFLSMSVTFTAESKEHVDAIYLELTASPEVIMTL